MSEDVITREELKKKLDAGEEFVLLNVLNRDNFERVHLPKSIKDWMNAHYSIITRLGKKQ